MRERYEYIGEDTVEWKGQLRTRIFGQLPRGTEGRTNCSDRGGSKPTLTQDAEEAEDDTRLTTEKAKRPTKRGRSDSDRSGPSIAGRVRYGS